jgi:hypothetical protein
MNANEAGHPSQRMTRRHLLPRWRWVGVAICLGAAATALTMTAFRAGSTSAAGQQVLVERPALQGSDPGAAHDTSVPDASSVFSNSKDDVQQPAPPTF